MRHPGFVVLSSEWDNMEEPHERRSQQRSDTSWSIQFATITVTANGPITILAPRRPIAAATP